MYMEIFINIHKLISQKYLWIHTYKDLQTYSHIDIVIQLDKFTYDNIFTQLYMIY